MKFAEMQATYLAAGYREERHPRRAGQRAYGLAHDTATAQQTTCAACAQQGLHVYPFYRPEPFAHAAVFACPACGWAMLGSGAAP